MSRHRLEPVELALAVGDRTRDVDGAIFISYRRADTDREASDLNRSLTARLGGERVFMDVDSLVPGVAWRDEISRMISGCATMVVLIGPDWNPPSPLDVRGRLFVEGDVVRAEIAAGLATGHPIVPVVVRGGRLPTASELPEDLRELADRQALIVEQQDLWTYEVERLTTHVERLVALEDGRPVYPIHAGLIGREALLEELHAALEADRLVTLTGAGGLGKTSIAKALASRRADTVFVDLTRVHDPADVPRAIALSVGVSDPEAGTEIATAALVLHRRGDVLVVVDNCEHVIGPTAEAVAELLSRVPELKILATSREALAIEGEVAIQVPPLSLPDEGAEATLAAGSPSVQLFVERARAADRGFVLDERSAPAVVDICRQLDGYPLAIELAASRVRGLDVADIAEHLSKRFDLLQRTQRTGEGRHRTMGAALDWSYGLLQPEDARLFDRLWIFEAGFDLEAADAVCGVDLDALTGVPALVDRSLVVFDHDQARYRLLEPIRQYSRSHAGTDADSLERLHAEHYVRLAERAEPEVRGPDQEAWSRRIRSEAPNIKAAAARASGRWIELLARLVAAMWFDWPGSITDMRKFARIALDSRGELTPDLTQSVVAVGAVMAFFANDFEEVLVLTGSLMDEAADESVLHHGLISRGSALRELGRYDEAIKVHERSRNECSIPWFIARAIHSIGLVQLATGDYDAAAPSFEDAAERFRSMGDLASAGDSIHGLAIVALSAGKIDHCLSMTEDLGAFDLPWRLTTRADAHRLSGNRSIAATEYREAFELAWADGNISAVCPVLYGIAGWAVGEKAFARAVVLLSVADRLTGGAGALATTGTTRRWMVFPQDVAATRGRAIEALGEGESQRIWRSGLTMQLERVPSLVDQVLAAGTREESTIDTS